MFYYYDNLPPTPIDEEGGHFVEVERIYCINWELTHPLTLDAVYPKLPGQYRLNSGPMWFGSDEDHPPFLWASVEPPGVQVYGVLKQEDWDLWHDAFLTALKAGDFPFRTDIC